MFDLMHDWLVRGIAAAKTTDPHDREAARACFKQVVRSRGTRPEQKVCAWLWLSEVEDDLTHKRQCLERALALEPNNPPALYGLALLDGRLKEAATPTTPKPQATPARASKAPAVRRYVCPKCGGKMTFNASRHSLICAYCDNHLSELEAIQQDTQASVQEQNFLATLPTATAQRWELAAARTINCQGCGATFTLPPLKITGECPFCGSPHVIETAPSDDLIEPEAILAFQFDVEIATQHIQTWLAEQPFKLERSGQPITTSRPRGVYLPFWTFDIGGELSWRSMAEVSRQFSAVLNNFFGSEHQDLWNQGSYSVYADDLLVPASHSLPLNLMNTVSDFNTTALSPYTGDLLAGWPTEIYQISLAAASLVARQQSVTKARQRLLYQISWKTFSHTPQIGSAGVLVESYKLVLLPVWIASFCHKHERYRLLVNGQTGQVAGEKPRSGMQQALKELLG
jgi:hypothetical protein